jgi:hypothetical protein
MTDTDAFSVRRIGTTGRDPDGIVIARAAD